jgi:hypothetical protein
MTHDELLASVNKYCESITSGQVWTTDKFIKALRAVVELHKPRDYKVGNWCVGCNADYEYPCPTIQAIEEELA